MSNSFTNQTMAQIELFTQTGQYVQRRLRAAQAPRREGGAAAPRRARREAHDAQPGAGRLHRRAGRGPLQARHLPVLEAASAQRGGGDHRPAGRDHLGRAHVLGLHAEGGDPGAVAVAGDERPDLVASPPSTVTTTQLTVPRASSRPASSTSTDWRRRGSRRGRPSLPFSTRCGRHDAVRLGLRGHVRRRRRGRRARG